MLGGRALNVGASRNRGGLPTDLLMDMRRDDAALQPQRQHEQQRETDPGNVRHGHTPERPATGCAGRYASRYMPALYRQTTRTRFKDVTTSHKEVAKPTVFRRKTSVR